MGGHVAQIPATAYVLPMLTEEGTFCTRLKIISLPASVAPTWKVALVLV